MPRVLLLPLAAAARRLGLAAAGKAPLVLAAAVARIPRRVAAAAVARSPRALAAAAAVARCPRRDAAAAVAGCAAAHAAARLSAAAEPVAAGRDAAAAVAASADRHQLPLVVQRPVLQVEQLLRRLRRLRELGIPSASVAVAARIAPDQHPPAKPAPACGSSAAVAVAAAGDAGPVPLVVQHPAFSEPLPLDPFVRRLPLVRAAGDGLCVREAGRGARQDGDRAAPARRLKRRCEDLHEDKLTILRTNGSWVWLV